MLFYLCLCLAVVFTAYVIIRYRRNAALQDGPAVPLVRLLLGLALREPRAVDLLDELRAGGLLACKAGDSVVRFLPPLNVSDADLEEGLEMIADALDILFGEEE